MRGNRLKASDARSAMLNSKEMLREAWNSNVSGKAANSVEATPESVHAVRMALPRVLHNTANAPYREDVVETRATTRTGVLCGWRRLSLLQVPGLQTVKFFTFLACPMTDPTGKLENPDIMKANGP